MPKSAASLQRPNANLHFLNGMVGASQASLGRIDNGLDIASSAWLICWRPYL
ncbi:hypothetical protein [Mesorhizobium escarrei]|uniref:Uncharacterized protein n=1 Tax=Mesorhizobium escarrei TaxID=666018 RepID=A0ABN8JCG4_9HYPH|nr:hypothetical protein [Mesorhizobium escarrei]CAH2395805.1 hypothetical protein MES5069_120006 [Mesorhizobium escarrei]